jgi:hypothetical protein
MRPMGGRPRSARLGFLATTPSISRISTAQKQLQEPILLYQGEGRAGNGDRRAITLG